MATDIPVKSVKKALDLLTILAFEDLKREGYALTALAHRMKMPVNTVHNLLKTMVACGYLAQTESGTYGIGPRMTDMGRLNGMLSAVASPRVRKRLDALCHAVEEAVTMATLADGRRVLLCQVDPRTMVRVDAATLEERCLFARPTGRVLAAYASPEELTRVLAQYGMPGAEWDGISSRKALVTALKKIKHRGYELIAHDNSELAAFAVPVVDAHGVLLGSLGCYAPAFRCGPARYESILTQLRQAAADLVEMLR